MRRLLSVSDRVFDTSPEAYKHLRHLRRLVERDLDPNRDWPQFEQLESRLAQVWAKKGPGAASPLKGMVYLVGAAVFWHETQHVYDSRAELLARLRGGGADFKPPLEAELRAWEAGCRFWEAGMAMSLEGGAEESSPFRCESRFPASYYCDHSLSVEFVVWIGSRIRETGRGLSELARGPEAGLLERTFTAYCAELERAESGNPLSLEGFRWRWGPVECRDKAVAIVLGSGWKSSPELCPAAAASPQDIRETARELKTWR